MAGSRRVSYHAPGSCPSRSTHEESRLLAALLLCFPGHRAGPGLSGRRWSPAQKIKQWGYSLRIIEDWNSIAPKLEDKWTVGN